MSDVNDVNDVNGDTYDGDDDFEDEVGGEGNRISGGRAVAVVDHIAKALVEDPDGVRIDVDERGDSVTLLVHASPGDMGRLIGKRGRVIQAVRQLARAAASAEGVRATVDVAD
jgi:predicted RNA-binding protein YlqC (UPF0109 family)